jgi:hypothetical protein
MASHIQLKQINGEDDSYFEYSDSESLNDSRISDLSVLPDTKEPSTTRPYKSNLSVDHFIALVCENQFLKMKIKNIEDKVEVLQGQLGSALQSLQLAVPEDMNRSRNISGIEVASALREIIRSVEKISGIQCNIYYNEILLEIVLEILLEIASFLLLLLLQQQQQKKRCNFQ